MVTVLGGFLIPNSQLEKYLFLIFNFRWGGWALKRVAPPDAKDSAEFYLGRFLLLPSHGAFSGLWLYLWRGRFGSYDISYILLGGHFRGFGRVAFFWLGCFIRWGV